MTYDKCKMTVGKTLKKRGFDNHAELAADMCIMWADENGVEREFAVEGKSKEPISRSFALSIGDSEDMTFMNDDDGIDTASFPVIAITSGLHEYEADDKQQKVYIEPSVLKSNIEAFQELPIYINHQRTTEDLIGMATDPEVVEMENGKTAVKMNATITNKTGHGQEVMDKVKQGDMTHVSIDWLSNDIDVMGDNYATKIRPTELSFIDNEKMDPVCKECTIEGKCELHAESKPCNCENDCECDGKRENEDKTTQVETMTEDTNVKSDAETADEERTLKEAEARKVETVEAIISKELLMGTVEEDNKDERSVELSAWDEMKLTGFSEALAAMPAPVDVERQFGKGKSNDGEAVPVTERASSVSVDNTGRYRIDQSKLRGN